MNLSYQPHIMTVLPPRETAFGSHSSGDNGASLKVEANRRFSAPSINGKLIIESVFCDYTELFHHDKRLEKLLGRQLL
jgi:hypothetical protein